MRKLITIDEEKLFFCYLRSDTVTQYSIYWDGTNFFVNLFAVVFTSSGSEPELIPVIHTKMRGHGGKERRGGEGRDSGGGRGEGM